MRFSVLFTLVGGFIVVGTGTAALAVLRAMLADRPVLGSWSDLVLLPFIAVGAWVIVHAMYGAAVQGAINDKNRRLREIKAALKASLKAGAMSPNEARDAMPDEATLDRAAAVVLDDLMTPAETRRADAELGGLTPPDLRDFTHPDFKDPK